MGSVPITNIKGRKLHITCPDGSPANRAGTEDGSGMAVFMAVLVERCAERAVLFACYWVAMCSARPLV